MTIDPPADSQSSAMASQSDFDKFCAECCWHGMDMTCSHPVVSPGHCLDFNCSNGNSNSSSSSRHDPTALQPRHPHPHPPPSQSGECELDVTCCEAEDCSSSSCTTVCDGFVDCDQSTVCSEDHCDDDECRDVATACYDENCGGDGGDDSLEQMTHDILAQTQNNPLQWNNGPSSYHLGHANGVFPTTPAYGSASEQGDGHGEFSAAENNQSALKPMDFNNYYHVSPHCTSGKLPHVFDSSMCHNQGTLVPGNVLHCTMSDPCCNLDACGQQQCNLDSSSFANCPTESHFGFVVPWNTPHASYPSHHLHQQQLPPRDMKTLEPQSCHHLPHNDTGPARSTPTHTPSLSTGSSPVSPPDARSQSIYSALTTPDLPSSSSAAEESHVCKWIHKKTNGPSTICGVSFPDTTSLQEHLVHAHSDAIGGTLGQGFYCCWEGCHRPGEPFSQKSKLQGHFLTHSNRTAQLLFRELLCGCEIGMLTKFLQIRISNVLPAANRLPDKPLSSATKGAIGVINHMNVASAGRRLRIAVSSVRQRPPPFLMPKQNEVLTDSRNTPANAHR